MRKLTKQSTKLLIVGIFIVIHSLGMYQNIDFFNSFVDIALSAVLLYIFIVGTYNFYRNYKKIKDNE